MIKIKEILKNKWTRVMLLLGVLSILYNSSWGFVLISGESMEPYYKSGDMVFINKMTYKLTPIKRHDIVTIKTKEGERLIKRIVGLAGDKIKIEEGFIYLNNEIVRDVYGRGRVYMQLVDENNKDLRSWETGEKVVDYTNEEEITIPKGCVWIMGDNRSMSWYGVLPIKNIEGLVIF
jgi:signal peptidase I